MIALGSDHGGLCPAEPGALCGDPPTGIARGGIDPPHAKVLPFGQNA